MKLAQILKESLLIEALPLDKARQYTSIKRNKSIQNRLDNIFQKLASLSNAKTSKRGDRVYIPYTASKAASPIQKDIEQSISSSGFKIKDYNRGIAQDQYGRDIKLGKVLSKLKQTDLLNKFNTDTARASSKTTQTYIVFSKHPYDIAGQSTDRDWTSCMNIFSGGNKRYVQYDIEQGTFVAYYISQDDLNINKPIGRINIKPFINIADPQDVIYSTNESKVYGNAPQKFEYAVNKILGAIQNVDSIGRFELDAKLYCDVGRGVIMTLPKRQDVKTTQDVTAVLGTLGVTNYQINDDLTIDVNGNVDISDENISQIPVNFNKVEGYFDCSRNNLTSLQGAPKQVGGNFNCTRNDLTSLQGAPKQVGRSFYCSRNVLTSLQGAPNKVEGNFNCTSNNLTSLQGAPNKVDGYFDCSRNNLTSLQGAPKQVDGYFGCYDNKLTSLQGAPNKVDGSFDCSRNNLTSLQGAPKQVDGDFYCSYNKLTSLQGAPKQVGGDFDCSDNIKKFTQQEVMAVCDVKGEINT